MVDLQDPGRRPELAEIGEAVRNPVFMRFCAEIMEKYRCKEKIEYSGCSWETGWNVKFRKAGKTLCTLYPKEGYFRVLLVVGAKEKARVEALLPECTAALQSVYRQTPEGNGQRWLTVDLEDQDGVYRDPLRLIQIRRGGPA